MKKFFTIFASIAIFSVSGCWNNAYPKPEAFNDADETEIVSDNDADSDFDPEQNDEDDDMDTAVFIDFDFNHEDEDSDPYTDPCDTAPCEGIAHSTGSCSVQSHDQYICECETGYFWDGERCINPCESIECDKKAHSTGVCVPQSHDEYFCRCEEGFLWNGEKCDDLPECAQRGTTPCRDSSTGLTWSAMYNDNWHQTKCGEISDGGYTDWVMPEICQLMTLIQNCQTPETGGCEASITSKYSKLGDTDTLWSKSISEESYFYVVNFSKGAVQTYCDILCAMMTEWSDYPPYSCLNCFESLPLRCTRCEEGYFWYEDKCVKSPCKEDSCTVIPHSTGTCYPITPETYSCSCESNYMWKESKCISPCENVTCDMPHSDGKCHAYTETIYKCGCDENYFWNDEDKTCVNPCDTKSCDMPHSNGICRSHSETSYSCGCEENYYWNSETEKCLNPCDEDPCGNDKHSTGECTPDSSTKYTCKCNNDSHWDKENRICFNPCDENPCVSPHSTGKCQSVNSGYLYSCECVYNYYWNYYDCVSPCDSVSCGEHENSTGECFAQNEYEYVCGCKNGYYWYGENRGCDPTKPTFGTLCTDLHKCIDEGEYPNCISADEEYLSRDAYYAELGTCAPHNFAVDSTVSSQKRVIDRNLGLEWQQTVTNQKYTWENAAAYCGNLTYGGHSDWRLPTPHELFTIVDNSRNTFDKIFFADTPSQLWTSKATLFYSDRAWVMTSYGNLDIEAISSPLPVMCVRGDKIPKASYKIETIKGNTVVTDLSTGLMWQKTYSESGSLYLAVNYCENLTFAGFSDWRVPNKHELLSLVDYDKLKPASDFPNSKSIIYWSSSINVHGSNYTWSINFDLGEAEYNYISNQYSYVRCVRNK